MGPQRAFRLVHQHVQQQLVEQLWQGMPEKGRHAGSKHGVAVSRGESRTSTGTERACPPVTHRLAYAAATWERGMSMVMATMVSANSRSISAADVEAPTDAPGARTVHVRMANTD